MIDPPAPFSLPLVVCPACGHGIDPHGTAPGGTCDVGTYIHEDREVSLCPCLWSPNDIAATLISEARADSRERTATDWNEAAVELHEKLEAARERTVQWMARYDAQVEAERQSLTDLRAKVAAIQPYTHTQDHTDVVRRTDVLGLIAGDQR